MVFHLYLCRTCRERPHHWCGGKLVQPFVYPIPSNNPNSDEPYDRWDWVVNYVQQELKWRS